jgi:hypothetical protein
MIASGATNTLNNLAIWATAFGGGAIVSAISAVIYAWVRARAGNLSKTYDPFVDNLGHLARFFVGQVADPEKSHHRNSHHHQ